GAPRGLPAGGLAAAAEHGLDRRQPAPVDALLVLAAQVPLPAARRRALPRPPGRAPRARHPRQRVLRLRPSLRPSRRAPRPAARANGETRVALAGVAPVPWLLTGSLDDATPLPGTAYKLEIARALVGRALAAVR